MAESTTTRFGLKRWTAGSDTPVREDFDDSFAALAENAAGWLPDDTAANRPAASAANARFLFRATDTSQVSFSTGSAWVDIPSDADVAAAVSAHAGASDPHTGYLQESAHTKTQHDGLSLDHGALSGKSDDDHTQYHTDARHDAHDHSTALGSASVGDLGDANVSSPADNEVLAWHNAAGEWRNQTPTEAGLSESGHGHDHGALSGLTDDDHAQYLNAGRHDITTRHPLSVLGDGNGLGLRTPALAYTTPGTSSFVKATYPWARVIRVRVQAAGGGGGKGWSTDGDSGSGGGGGGYAEALLSVAALPSSVTVTVGAGGGGNPGSIGTPSNPGGGSSFGSLVVAGGGQGGLAHEAGLQSVEGGAGGSATVGDILIPGQPGGAAWNVAGGSGANIVMPGSGGNTALGHGHPGRPLSNGGSTTGESGRGFGAGGSGGANDGGGTAGGGTGLDGVVFIELYA